MAQFYGTIQGNRGEASRVGSGKSGIHAHIRSWNNDVYSSIVEADDGKDKLQLRIPEEMLLTINNSYNGKLKELIECKEKIEKINEVMNAFNHNEEMESYEFIEEVSNIMAHNTFEDPQRLVKGTDNIIVDDDLLRKQTLALLNSDIAEEEKEGLHNLLGTIKDMISDKKEVTIRGQK